MSKRWHGWRTRGTTIGALVVVAGLLFAACAGDEAPAAPSPTPATGATGTPAATDDDDGVQPPAEPGPLAEVAVSTPVLADIVANVVGERATVWSVIPPGADPHTYEPTPREVARTGDADLFFFMGARLEDYLRTAAWRRTLRDSGIPTVEFAERMDLITIDRIIDHGDHVHDLTGGDPHVWLDPRRVVELVEIIVDSLVEIDPAAAEYYAANADAYVAELERLHQEYLAVIDRIPEERRQLIVFHDAYTYFEDRYGFEVIGVVLPNPHAEPSAREIADLHELIEDVGIDVVFKEPQFNAQILEQLARDQGIAVGILMTDTFTNEVTTYLDLMRFNLRSLEQHLVP
jgi:manganese/iron transport system substrate-binding protein